MSAHRVTIKFVRGKFTKKCQICCFCLITHKEKSIEVRSDYVIKVSDLNQNHPKIIQNVERIYLICVFRHVTF